MNAKRSVAAIGVAILLAACAGTDTNISPLQGTSPSTPSSHGAARSLPDAHRRKGRLTVRIRIPKKHRGAHYISAATKGMTMAIAGPSTLTQVVNLTPSDPRCTGSPITCTIAVTLLPGSYTVTIDTYDEAPAGGSIPAGANLLSMAKNAPFTMTGGFDNAIGITLDGVPASLVVSGLPSGSAGTAFGLPFTVTAKDADGDTIVGTYTNPVTLANSDTAGATTVATSGSDSPPAGQLLSSSDVATLNYTGLAIEPVTITASATGATNGTGTFAPALQPIVLITSDTLNPSWAGVDLHASSGSGSTADFKVSEVGWSNAPYNKRFAVSTGGGCSTIGSISPANGLSFTATVAASPSAGTCGATITDGVGQSSAMTLAYTLFAFTGAAQSIAVPSGVAKATITAMGAEGDASCMGTAGLGASVTATIPIATPAEALAVYVGGSGTAGNGFNGGAGNNDLEEGGGASDVREGGIALANRVVVAGGGGQTGCSPSPVGGDNGGNGGAPGANGGNGANSSDEGGGGTQIAGGAGGTSLVGAAAVGKNGTLGIGGLSGESGVAGGDGGGGYNGGGGGGVGESFSSAGGGGGGSSFAEATATGVTGSAGGNPDPNGQVIIIW